MGHFDCGTSPMQNAACGDVCMCNVLASTSTSTSLVLIIAHRPYLYPHHLSGGGGEAVSLILILNSISNLFHNPCLGAGPVYGYG
jgi:hypothetical protein